MGFSSHSSVSPTRMRASSARWRGSLRNVAPCRRESSSANWKPALCRVRAYSVPGLPSPTISLSGSPAMSLTHTANAAGRRRSALAPAAAGDGSEQCLWWRLLLAALLPGRSGFLLLPALLGLAGGGRSAWGGGRSARGRRGCSARSRGSACNGGSRALGGHGGGGLCGNRLGLLGTRSMNRYDRRVTLRELGNRHARRQRDIRQELGVVEAHARKIQRQEFRQVLRQAADLDVGAHVRYHAALGLDAGRHALSAEVDRQPDTDRLVLDHALQIHVHDHVLRRVHLHVLDDGFLGALADLQPHDRGVEALVGDHGEKILLVENQRLGVLAGAVQDGGDLAGVTQAAARTLALRLADIRAEGERNTHYMSPLVTQHRRSATRPASHETQSTYSELTDSSSRMRRMVSASSSATDSWRMRLAPVASALSGIVSVTTSSSSADCEILCTAPPDSTGCVM